MLNYNKVYELTKDLNILYVEDDLNFAKETSEVFDELFDKVDMAYDGEEAITKYLKYYESNNKYYDIVITDISMPKQNGLSLIECIYKINKSQNIIVISAHNNSENLFELVNMGIEQFLLKPLDFSKVLQTIYDCALKLKNTSFYVKEKEVIILSDNFTYNKKEQILYKNQKIVKLTKKESKLLQILIKNGSKISTFNEIYSILWVNNSYVASQELLKPIISRFRKKLPENKLENLYGLGYKLSF